MLYKVVKEEGVTVDNVEFAKNEVLELEPESFNVSDLLAEGSIVEFENTEDEKGDEPVLPGEDTPKEE